MIRFLTAFMVVGLFLLVPLTPLVYGGWFSAGGIPDIAIDRIETVPPVPQEGTPFRFKITIRNEAKTAVKDAPLFFSYRALNSASEVVFLEKQTEYISELESGKKVVIETTKTGNELTGGVYSLRFGPVYIGGKLKNLEKDLDDNSLVHTFVIVEKELDDSDFPELEAEESIDDLREMRQKARVLWKKGLYADADGAYRKIITLADRSLDETHDFTMATLKEHFEVVRELGNKKRASVVGDEYIQRLIIINGENSQTVVESYLQMALVFDYSQKRKAAEYYELAYGIIQLDDPPSFGLATRCYYNYSQTLLSLNQPQKALKLMEKYISAVEGSAAGASIMMTYLVKNMEKACRILNINCENLPAYEKAVALNEARLNPPQNPQKEDSVKALRERAWHEYNEKQNYEKGYELMFSALKLGREQWGKKSGNLVDLHSGLSLMAKRLGKYTVAEKCLKANVALGEASKLGSRKRMHVHACFALAELYEKQLKDEKKAEYWFRESVKVAQKQFGRDHVDTAYYYSSLGRYYTGHDSVREGVELLERSRDIYFKSEGPESTRGLQHEQTIKRFRQAQ